MNRWKLIAMHTMMISFGVLVGLTLQGVLYHFVFGLEFALHWYHPFSIVVTGFGCSLPSLLLQSDRPLSKKRFCVRVLLHCLSLFTMVMLLGRVFYWYDTILGGAFVAGIFLLVYVFVWASTAWFGFMSERDINKALKNIQDKE